MGRQHCGKTVCTCFIPELILVKRFGSAISIRHIQTCKTFIVKYLVAVSVLYIDVVKMQMFQSNIYNHH